MEVLPVRIRTLTPPHDDLIAAVGVAAPDIRDGDCIAIASKVVSIWKGQCILIDPDDPDQRKRIAQQEASWYCEGQPPYRSSPRLYTITHNTLIGGAGIDVSNGAGYYVLLPKDPQACAAELRALLMNLHQLTRLAVIITDSYSTPLRRGAIGYALAWAGLEPLRSHVGTRDLFGNELRVEHSNIAGALAAAAVLVMGETAESTPLAIIRDAPYVNEPPAPSPHDIPYTVSYREDMLAPFLTSLPWTRGGGQSTENDQHSTA